jgi:hypothetical protein
VSPVPLTDANLHLLDGALLSGSGAYSAYVAMMADLYNADPTANIWTDEATWQTSVTNTGSCGKFVYDSVNNTLRLPKYDARYLKSTLSASDLGDLVNAQAPNIKGKFIALPACTSAELDNNHAQWLTEAFKDSYPEVDPFSARMSGGSLYSSIYYDFKASNSNPIYGDSATTIDTDAVKVYYYIVLGTVSKTDIQIDIDNVLTDLNGKADTDLSNTVPTSAFATALNTVGIRTLVETYDNGLSWYRLYSDGWCIQHGVTAVLSHGQTVNNVAFLKTIADPSSVNIILQRRSGTGNYTPIFTNVTQTDMSIENTDLSSNTFSIDWYVIGYVAS